MTLAVEHQLQTNANHPSEICVLPLTDVARHESPRNLPDLEDGAAKMPSRLEDVQM